jgi:hypothetical protein
MYYKLIRILYALLCGQNFVLVKSGCYKLVERQLLEVATTRGRLEELRVARVGEAQKVWDFLGQTEAALVLLGFSPLHTGDPVEEVSAALPLLGSAWAKMLKLEDVTGGQLEAKGHALAEAVAEYVLTCFRSRDPQISLEPVAQGPITEMDEATQAGIQDIAKLIAARFDCEPVDA